LSRYTFGFTNPVLVDRDNTILAGHGRVEAARLIGMDVNPGAKRVSFPERYWSVGLRLGARGHLIADAQQCAKSGDQSRIAFIVV